ncbi:MAG: hypothetical protein IT426_15555 [Pirellulales bacterium]|nr:hypothetical protein [Pirellulales bacterium]
MRKTCLILMVLFSFSMAGCGNSTSQRLIGKWKFDAAKAAGKLIGEDKDGKAAAALGMMQAMGMKMEMVIEFKADKTANVTTTGLPSPFSGVVSWKVTEAQGDKLTIEITNPKENKTSKVQITFTDNDHLQFSPPDANAKSMEFERVKQ